MTLSVTLRTTWFSTLCRKNNPSMWSTSYSRHVHRSTCPEQRHSESPGGGERVFALRFTTAMASVSLFWPRWTAHIPAKKKTKNAKPPIHVGSFLQNLQSATAPPSARHEHRAWPSSPQFPFRTVPPVRENSCTGVPTENGPSVPLGMRQFLAEIIPGWLEGEGPWRHCSLSDDGSCRT